VVVILEQMHLVVFHLSTVSEAHILPSQRGVKKDKRKLKRFIVTGKYVHKFSFMCCRMVAPNMHPARRRVSDRIDL